MSYKLHIREPQAVMDVDWPTLPAWTRRVDPEDGHVFNFDGVVAPSFCGQAFGRFYQNIAWLRGGRTEKTHQSCFKCLRIFTKTYAPEEAA